MPATAPRPQACSAVRLAVLSARSFRRAKVYPSTWLGWRTLSTRSSTNTGESRKLACAISTRPPAPAAWDLRRRAPRAFAPAISRYVFERGVTEDGPPLPGIRQRFRLGDDIPNWAIFEGTEPEEIRRDDPDLLLVLETPGVVMES